MTTHRPPFLSKKTNIFKLSPYIKDMVRINFSIQLTPNTNISEEDDINNMLDIVYIDKARYSKIKIHLFDPDKLSDFHEFHGKLAKIATELSFDERIIFSIQLPSEQYDEDNMDIVYIDKVKYSNVKIHLINPDDKSDYNTLNGSLIRIARELSDEAKSDFIFIKSGKIIKSEN